MTARRARLPRACAIARAGQRGRPLHVRHHLRRAESVGEAYESLKKAIALDPDNPRINYVLGAVATHRPDRSEAIRLREVCGAHARRSPGLFALGAAYFYSNQFEQARLTLEKAAARKETAAGAHYFLARIARQSNDLETAQHEIDASLRHIPSTPTPRRGGFDPDWYPQYAEAEKSIEKALAIDPQQLRRQCEPGHVTAA